MSLYAVWHNISELGLSSVEDPLEKHSVALTNRIAMVAFPVIISLVVILGLRQWNSEPLFILFASIFFLIIPIFNAIGYTEAARLVLCFLLPIIIMGMSVISKMIPDEEITNSEFFDYRYVLIISSVVSPIVFNFRRKRLLFIGVVPFFLSLAFFDEIHELFGVGFYQVDHDIDSYPTTTWVSSLMFLVLSTVLFMLRWSSDSLQVENNTLIKDLRSAKDRLKIQNQEILDAHKQIKHQNILLNEKNDLLSDRIQLATRELQESNAELIKHNNELKQFSHTVSHNLRGPVATILGISEMARIASDDERDEYLEHLFKSAKLLDSNIRDLATILEIRKDIFRVRRKVLFKELFDDILFNYENEIKENNVTVETRFDVDSIYTIKPFIVSILDNLFSNALKYYSNNRSPIIRISTSKEKNNTVVKVWDNGIGIDLKTHENNLFKLYKRFNTQREGKGIGLYLVMKQVESLEGNITVNSEINKFTEFTLSIPEFVNVKHQPLVEEDYITVSYNAVKHCISLEWKQAVETRELSDSIEQIFNTLKALEPNYLILDVRKRGHTGIPNETWMREEFFPKVFKTGLRKLAILSISDSDEPTRNYFEKWIEDFEKNDIELKFITNSEALSFSENGVS